MPGDELAPPQQADDEGEGDNNRPGQHPRAAVLAGPADRDAGSSSEACQQNALGKKLADEPPAAGAQGGPHGNFALPSGAADKKQIGQVYAAD